MYNDCGKGNSTKTGLLFEKKTLLSDKLKLLEEYSNTTSDEVIKNTNVVGLLLEKHKLYRYLKSKNIIWKSKLSKKILPDECFYNFIDNTFYIIEKKFQKTAGSVDEKLQTCYYKLNRFKKLLEDFNCNVKYCYLLSDWFNKDSYKDTLNYIIESGCDYFINEIPLEYLGLKNGN